MKIKHKLEFVIGDFDTETDKLICVSNKKYGSVALCFKSNMNIVFAEIRLFSSNLAVDADTVFTDAMALGNEIAARWNKDEQH